MRENLDRAVDLIAAIVGIGAIMMLLRPGSKGPTIVSSFMGAFVDAIAGAEGATITPNTPSTTVTIGTTGLTPAEAAANQAANAAAGIMVAPGNPYLETASGPTQYPIGATLPAGVGQGPNQGPANPSLQQSLRNAFGL